MNAKQLMLLVLLGSSFGAVAATGNPEKGQVLAQNCVACHNADGNSVNPQWPKIAGQHEKYLIKQLMDLRRGPESGRSNPLMVQINEKLNIKDLSDQDIIDMAAYYNAQKQTGGDAFSDTAALGERIYKGGNPKTGVTACMSCHASSGIGNSLANYPRLAGQHAEYTYTQLKNFQSGQRANDASAIMRSIAKHMTEEEMKAVSNYIQGMRTEVESKDEKAKEDKPKEEAAKPVAEMSDTKVVKETKEAAVPAKEEPKAEAVKEPKKKETAKKEEPAKEKESVVKETEQKTDKAEESKDEQTQSTQAEPKVEDKADGDKDEKSKPEPKS